MNKLSIEAWLKEEAGATVSGAEFLKIINSLLRENERLRIENESYAIIKKIIENSRKLWESQQGQDVPVICEPNKHSEKPYKFADQADEALESIAQEQRP